MSGSGAADARLTAKRIAYVTGVENAPTEIVWPGLMLGARAGRTVASHRQRHHRAQEDRQRHRSHARVASSALRDPDNIQLEFWLSAF